MARNRAAPDVDLSEFRTVSPSGQRLRLDTEVLASLDATDPAKAANLRAALAEPTITNYRIMKVLRSWGFTIHEGSVRNWRDRYHPENRA